MFVWPVPTQPPTAQTECEDYDLRALEDAEQVERWRSERFEGLGFDTIEALELARGRVDWHTVALYLERHERWADEGLRREAALLHFLP